MRILTGFILLGVGIYLLYVSLSQPDFKSVGRLLLSLAFLFVSYICLRQLIMKPFEMLGFAFFFPTTIVDLNHRRFREVNEFVKSGKIQLALVELDKMLLKKPNLVEAQILKLQLLGNNLYDIQKAKTFGESVLSVGSFNRDKMQLLIILGAMLRKHGFPAEAVKLSASCRDRAPKSLQKLIDKMDEGWNRADRNF